MAVLILVKKYSRNFSLENVKEITSVLDDDFSAHKTCLLRDTDEWGNTPLHILCENFQNTVHEKKLLALFLSCNEFCSQGMNLFNCCGRTPFHYILLQKKYPQVVFTLLSTGANFQIHIKNFDTTGPRYFSVLDILEEYDVEKLSNDEDERYRHQILIDFCKMIVRGEKEKVTLASSIIFPDEEVFTEILRGKEIVTNEVVFQNQTILQMISTYVTNFEEKFELYRTFVMLGGKLEENSIEDRYKDEVWENILQFQKEVLAFEQLWSKNDNLQ